MSHQPMNRRTFLRGTGVCIALPFLEAMLPIRASAAVAGAPQRFVGMMFPNGCIITPTENNWECSGSGSNYTFATALQPLAPYKNYVSPIINLTNGAYKQLYAMEAGQSHWYASPSYLTGQPIAWKQRFTGVKLMNPGASVDQLIAQISPTQIKSLVMGVEQANGAYNDPFFGSDHIATEISYASQTVMPDRLDSSAKVFNALFSSGGGNLPTSPTTPSNMLSSRRKSIIDVVKGDIDSLLKKLGTRDKVKMDEFLTSVSTLEKKVQADLSSTTPPPATGGGSCKPADGSIYTNDSNPANGNLGQRCKNMLDLLVIAFQCDMTRVGSFMFGNENTNVSMRLYDPTLPDYSHHGASHYHTGGALAKEYFNQFNTWQAKQLAYLLGKLQNTSDAYGPLIENTLVMFGSGMSDGEHFTYNFNGRVCENWDKIPMLLAGRGGGHRAGNLVNANFTDHANMMAAITQAFGAGSKVGNSTGILPGLF